MKSIFRNYLINLGALWATTQILPAIVVTGELRGLLTGALAFMLANIILVPLLKILLLPLNLLTFGFFAWVGNILALYLLVTIIPSISVMPYFFPGTELNGFIIPSINFSSFQVAILASLIIGFIIHFLQWLLR